MVSQSKYTLFSDVANLGKSLEKTSKRTEKTELIRAFLNRLKEEEIAPAVSLITGKVFPGADQRALEVGWSTIERVLKTTQRDRSPHNPLTLLDVKRYFNDIAAVSGKGSRADREKLLGDLLGRATPLEQEYLLKNIFGEMQHGVGEGVMMAAIAETAAVKLDLVRRATMFCGDLGEVARVALTVGKEGLDRIEIQLFHPIQPMLAQMAEGITEALARHGGKSAFEFKFDGARVQIHKRDENIEVFSRSLSQVTPSLPEIVQIVKEKVKAREAILEGEVIAMGKGGKPLPFQDVMRRFRRVHKVGEISKQVPVRLWLFDLLYLDGKGLIDHPYRERWKVLSKTCPKSLLANRVVTGDQAAAHRFLKKAMKAGHEGLIAKDLHSPYAPGARGERWLKIKPAETLDLVILAADWGYGRRTGWLSNYHLGAKKEDGYAMLGKTFKGLTDEEFTEMTKKLLELKTSQTEQTVFVKPRIVVEVAFNEIQHSPHYPSGFALGFARIKNIRYDKIPEEADTIERVNQLYQLQFRHKAKSKMATEP